LGPRFGLGARPPVPAPAP